MLETFKQLDDIRLNFSQEGLFTLNLTLAFIMFGVALEIKTKNFVNIVKNPKSAFIGIISQFFFLPFITFLLILIFRNYITPTIAFGMILVASCPGGNISNFISSLARGNTELSVSLTAFATMAAIFMTPLNFALWGGLYTKLYNKLGAESLLRPLEIDPFQMFQTVFILLGIPLVVGMWFSWKFPGITRKIIKPIKALSIFIFMGIVVMAFSNNYDYFILYIKYVFIIVLLHNALALGTGFTLASLFNLKDSDRRSVTIETGIQNSGLGLVLIFNPKIFPVDLAIGGMAFIAAWWGIWHILAGLGIAGSWSFFPYKNKSKKLNIRIQEQNEY